MCIFHKWGRWEQFNKDIPERQLSEKWCLSGCVEHWQKRVCKKCGKVQLDRIGQTVKS